MKPRRNPFLRPWCFPRAALVITLACGGTLESHAGDILRGGRTGSAPQGAPPTIGNTPPPIAAPSNPNDTLARTSMAIQSVEAMQLAAREIAGNSPGRANTNPSGTGNILPVVPDGLGPGGLQPDPGAVGNPALWTGAERPVQSAANGRTEVKVTQTAQQALLNWQTFNVGKETTLKFDQSAAGENAGQWTAFNFVNDPGANPTRILGSIEAQGQVFVMNRNGVVFGGASQVNVRGLTVSSLPVNTNLIERGLLNNPDSQFLFSGLDLPAGTNGTPAFHPQPPNPATGRYGDIHVEEGAVLNSPTNDAGIGGRIALIGPNVTNEGSISTPDGQTILAAGLQVGFTGHDASDPSLRGLDVSIGSVGGYGGTATNAGIIKSPRGNITLAGSSVNQLGVLDATTSVSLNGRVDLLANYNAIPNTGSSAANAPFLFRDSGTVTLGEGSVIRILPELESGETTIGTELALRSRVNVTGRAIHLGKGSILHAPNAVVDLSAGEWLLSGGANPISRFVQSAGQVYFDHDSLIDVSGSRDVRVPVSQNIVSVDLRGAELANSPLQRLGSLRNQTISVDIRDTGVFNGETWIGTPLADVSGFANLIQRRVGELTVGGGSVNISAGSSVVMQQGSLIDVSGGSIAYTGGMVQTSRLITADGRIVDIRDARPDQVYIGIYDNRSIVFSERWGITGIFQKPIAPDGRRYEAAHLTGAGGGSLSFTAPSMALDGAFAGRTLPGSRQQQAPPAPASLSLSFTARDTGYPSLPIFAPAAPVIVIQDDKDQTPADPFLVDSGGNPADLRADRRELVVLSPGQLTSGGFGSITIRNPDGGILLPEDVTFTAVSGSSLAFHASNITIDGSLIATGGSLSFTTANLPLSTVNLLSNTTVTTSPQPEEDRGIFRLGGSGVITTAGALVDDRLTAAGSGFRPLFLDGGSVFIQGYSVLLDEGGLIDVSGGAVATPGGAIRYGNAGSLGLNVGRDPNVSSLSGGEFRMDAALHGYSGATAGLLSLTAPAIQIGGVPGDARVTLLDPLFFHQGGFGSYNLAGAGLATGTPDQYIPGLRIAEGTVIAPVVASRRATFTMDGGFAFSDPMVLEEGVRSPAHLTFRATGVSDPFTSTIQSRGDVVMDRGSSILTDGLGSVTFSGQTVSIHGSVLAPGGSIQISGAASFPSIGDAPLLPTVLIGGTASLSTAGKVVLLSNPLDLREGKVLAGGSINVAGNIVAQRGAVLDVSGASGVFDLPPSSLSLDPAELNSINGRITVPVPLSSNAGSITLAGSRMLHTDATLIGHAGGETATGGSLNVSSGRYVEPGASFTSADINLVVRQGGLVFQGPGASQAVGSPSLGENGAPLPGLGIFTIDSAASGGFHSLTLGGNVRFEGDVNLAASGHIRLATSGVIEATGNVSVTAPHIYVGQSFRPPAAPGEVIDLFTLTVPGVGDSRHHFAPIHGSGNLKLSGGLIDVGTLSLQQIGSASFLAPAGDIRGNGTLQAAGNLDFTAGQIYPTTASTFHIFAYDHTGDGTRPGSIIFRQGDLRPLPLTAGGTLTAIASIIEHGGRLTAPMGTVNLGWNGDGDGPANPVAGNLLPSPVTSRLRISSTGVINVSAIDPITGEALTIPYGFSPDGNSWIDPHGVDISLTGPPAKAVNLSAADVRTEEGSLIDISGGGDLYAFRWVEGNGGRNDLLASSGSFAVIPGYGFDHAPYAPFSADSGHPGYVNSSLRAGDRITLAAGSGLPAGTYTLLPARYALLPGAFLVTPRSGTPVGSIRLADGSHLVSGYRANHLASPVTEPTVISRFEVAPASVVRNRSEYHDALANETFRRTATTHGLAVPRLPMDAGYLSFASTTGLAISGSVKSLTPENGRGSLIDISSPVNILINATGTGGNTGGLVLGADVLNSFGAESLVIGGLRNFTPEGATLTVTTRNLTLDNAGTPLAGPDIVLAARESLTLADGSEIHSTEGAGALDRLSIGLEDSAGSGDGVLVRASRNDSGSILRHGVSTSATPALSIGRDASIAGGSIILDSTHATSLDPAAILHGRSVSLHSGRISILLDQPGTVNPTTGLVLSGEALESIQSSARKLSLLSYSSLDVYGTGQIGSRSFESLALQAATIRGYNQNGGTATFSAAGLLVENTANREPAAPTPSALDGVLSFDADRITLGDHSIVADGFANVSFTADHGILFSGTGSFRGTGDIVLHSRLLTGAQASNHAISASGLLRLDQRTGENSQVVSGGLGATLLLEGGHVEINGDIALPSGQLTLRATSGDLLIGHGGPARIDLDGTGRTFIDVVRHTNGGIIHLIADSGSVRLANAADLSVSAPSGGGNAGAIHVSTPGGAFDLNGTIRATASPGSRAGTFSLDAATIADGNLAALDATLNAGHFTFLRDYRIRQGDVLIDGSARSHHYRVAADSGGILVRGTIDASGRTGGTIDLKAHGSLILDDGASLTVAAENFDSAGKGGAIALEAGAHRDGIIDPSALLDLRTGSSIDLGVASNEADSQSLGQFTGSLHLRAPRTTGNDDLRIAAIGGSITGASKITVEGYRLYDLTGTGIITTAVQNSIRDDAAAFLGIAGTASPGYDAMLARLTALNPTLDLILTPGAEIINRTGSLTLGATNSTATSDWNLASFRFGPRSAAGVLTLRAAEDLIFHNALSDGFSGGPSLWLSPLLAHNPLLPANAQSWSYHLTAGADFSAVSFREILPAASLQGETGTIRIGKNMGGATASGGQNAVTSSIIGNNFQVIRTGSGDIEVNAANHVRFLNPFASIYTAGTQVADPNSIRSAGDFITPILNLVLPPLQSGLGAFQQNYEAQYSMAGGNVTISAGGNIERKTSNNSGLIDDSSRQLPNNWLHRRSHVDAGGNFGGITIGTAPRIIEDPAASTTWWIDFSNFFQGVGALGGGNVSLAAGNDISNVDAVIPTNARAPMGRPDAVSLLELGGGNLTVTAGNDISGGIYYVERGAGALEAGRNITTNATRSPSSGLVGNLNNPNAQRLDPQTWIPTLLFVGKSTFDVTARGDILIGPATNPFLLPQGLNNRFWYKTFFNTFSENSGVTVTSLGGDVTLRNAVTIPNTSTSRPVLHAWLESQNLLTNTNNSTAWSQPWLRLTETAIAPLTPSLSLAAPNLSLNSLSGNLNLAGNITLFPSATGQLELFSVSGISGLQSTGLSNTLIPGRSTRAWTASTINLSDANPASAPSVTSPLTPYGLFGSTASLNINTQANVLSLLSNLFTESGSFTGINAVSQTKQARHAPGLLHLNDEEPVRIYTLDGNLSGITLFAPKQTHIIAGQDITDVSFYIQNLAATDTSIVSAGRDIIAYNSNSPLRLLSRSPGNAPVPGAAPLAGDIQISGPGTLQVLAGRNLDLGIGPNNPNGTGTGITSIGNLRNPYLPSHGADLLIAAGIRPASSLSGGSLDFPAFLDGFILTPEGAAWLDDIAPGVDFDTLSGEEQAALAIKVFYRILRDTGRDFNNPESEGFGNYDRGMAAIKALFGENPSAWQGEILTRARDIRTRSGGDISILVPGGGLAMANTTLGNPLTPPGIITESGGNVSLFTGQSVDIGIGRIFTLRGGDAIIWSTNGDIAAGSSSRTIQSAPPTRVVIDPQSASVETDLAGLATGGGIGVLATVAGVKPGDVDLIAPSGIIDAGDGGIRVSGNINLAATQVVNAGNISAGGSTTGGAASVSSPSVAAVAAASSANTAASSAPVENRETEQQEMETRDLPSLLTVEVIGYGGAADEEEEEE